MQISIMQFADTVLEVFVDVFMSGYLSKRETERQSGATDSSTDLCRVGKQRKKKNVNRKMSVPQEFRHCF